MKVKLKVQTTEEVEISFPSFFKAEFSYSSFVYYALYDEQKCLILYWDGSHTTMGCEAAANSLNRNPHQPITREEFRGELMKQCNSLILQTY